MFTHSQIQSKIIYKMDSLGIAGFTSNGADEYSNNLLRKLVQQVSVDFGILLTRVANQYESTTRKRCQNRLDGCSLMGLLRRHSQLISGFPESKSLQVKRSERISLGTTELVKRFVELPGAARDKVKHGTRRRAIAIEFGHPHDRDEMSRECVAKQVSTISNIAVFDRIVNVRNNRNARRFNELQSAGK